MTTPQPIRTNATVPDQPIPCDDGAPHDGVDGSIALDAMTALLACPEVVEVRQGPPAVLCSADGRVHRQRLDFVALTRSGRRVAVVLGEAPAAASTALPSRLAAVAASLPTDVADALVMMTRDAGDPDRVVVVRPGPAVGRGRDAARIAAAPPGAMERVPTRARPRSPHRRCAGPSRGRTRRAVAGFTYGATPRGIRRVGGPEDRG